MTETKEQELKPMEFKDLTADYILSQEWRCNNPNYGGIFIDYPSAMVGRVTECLVLSPNHHFKYPEVYQEFCERICEKHNQNLHQSAPQWSQEPPTEEGWYFVGDERTLMRITRSENGDLRVRNTRYVEIDPPTVDAFIKQWEYEQWLRTKKIVHCYWYKVGSPPPLPTEGRAE